MSADILRILVVLIGIAVVAIVLFQQPKDGGISAFTGGGGGASNTIFGAKGSGSFLFRMTVGLALAFAIAVIALVKVTNTDMSGDILSKTPSAISTENDIPGNIDSKTKKLEKGIPGTNSVKKTSDIPGILDNSSVE